MKKDQKQQSSYFNKFFTEGKHGFSVGASLKLIVQATERLSILLTLNSLCIFVKIFHCKFEHAGKNVKELHSNIFILLLLPEKNLSGSNLGQLFSSALHQVFKNNSLCIIHFSSFSLTLGASYLLTTSFPKKQSMFFSLSFFVFLSLIFTK